MSVSTLVDSQTNDTVIVSIDELRVGATCRRPLVDDTGVLLLGAGLQITPDLIQGLRDRGIEELAVSTADAAILRSESARPVTRKPIRPRTEPLPVEGEHSSKWRKGVPLRESMVNRFAEPLDPGRAKRLQEHLHSARGEFEGLQLSISEQKLQTIDAMSQLSSAFAMSIVDDHDQTLGHLVRPASEISVTDRSVKLSVMGMAVATQMELDGPSVLEVGTTGLLHDVGLFNMDLSLSAPGRGPLTEEQMWEYRKHPVVSANCLREVSDVPNSVLIAIEQVHEQFDGSGFPFGMEGKRAHVYARILNVCDAFLQLTLGMSYRKPLVPHDAMGMILHQARYGMFDPAVVHAFLRAESLFPLGSRVQLSNGQLANVIRRPEHGYARPVLESDDGERIETSEQLTIARPVADESCAQVRMSLDEMQSIRWNPADELILN